MSALELPDWHYDDRRHVGLDFASASEVATYDDRQASDIEGDRRLLSDLDLRAAHVLADFGCGTGLFVAAAAMACHLVHAIDISSTMLEATMAIAVKS